MLHHYNATLDNSTAFLGYDIYCYKLYKNYAHDFQKYALYVAITCYMFMMFYVFGELAQQRWIEYKLNLALARAKRVNDCDVERGAPVEVITDADDDKFGPVHGVSFSAPFKRNLRQRNGYRIR